VGWGKAAEIRGAIRDISAAGKRTVAWLELSSFGANLEYFVASAADEVYIAPGSRAPLVGLAAEFLFLGGLWEKAGVEVEVERIGRYKSAADFLAGKQMTESHREMANALLDSLDEQFVAGIAEGRELTPEFVRRAVDQAPVTPEEMKALGLVDGVLHRDEVLERLGGGKVVEASDYARVPASDVGFEPVAQLALVYGSGSVVSGDGRSSRTGAPLLASDTVGRALLDAAEDDEIAGIIFRIDSPGGSALASDEVWRATQRARAKGKPVIASFSDVAASGGYYVACGADAILSPAGAVTGSIGVLVLRPVLSGLLEKLGIGVESLTRGAHADLLLGSRPLSEASRARLRDEVESIYQLFLERVAAGRSLPRERVDELGQGRVYTGAQAVALGLVDEVGGLRDAVARAKRELHLDPAADVALVPYPAPESLSRQLSDALRRAALSAALELPPAGLARRLEAWLPALTQPGPALLPSLVYDVR
jgi:protease-4